MIAPASDMEKFRFAEMLPEIRGRLVTRFRYLDAEAKGECVAESTAHAFGLFVSAYRRGKKLTPGNLAWAAGKMTVSGREFGSPQNIMDAMSPMALAQGRSRKTISLSRSSLQESEEGAVFAELLTSDRNGWAIGDQVAFKLDWHRFLGDQPKRTRKVCASLAQGHTRAEVAARMHVSRPAITQKMAKVQKEWETFQDDHGRAA